MSSGTATSYHYVCTTRDFRVGPTAPADRSVPSYTTAGAGKVPRALQRVPRVVPLAMSVAAAVASSIGATVDEAALIKVAEIIVEKCILPMLPPWATAPPKTAALLRQGNHVHQERTATKARIVKALSSPEHNYSGYLAPSPLLSVMGLYCPCPSGMGENYNHRMEQFLATVMRARSALSPALVSILTWHSSHF